MLFAAVIMVLSFICKGCGLAKYFFIYELLLCCYLSKYARLYSHYFLFLFSGFFGIVQ